MQPVKQDVDTACSVLRETVIRILSHHEEQQR